jgi:alcohol dehydrogenase
MTVTMPPKITAATALDALTHSVEAFIGPQKNPVSDAFAASAITLIRENAVRAVERGKDEQVRLAMANAALLAGVAFSNSMVGIVHAAAHALGGVCHLPHGVANGIMLPHGMEFNMDAVGERVAALLLPLAGEQEYVKVPEAQRATESVAAVRKLTSELGRLTGIPVRLKEAGVNEEVLPQVAEATINDGAIAYNPKPVTLEDALNLLKAAY